MNNNGCSVKITLWGVVAEAFGRQIVNEDELNVVLLPAMNITKFKGALQLSNTSATLIFSSNDVPEIAALRAQLMNGIMQLQYNQGNFLQLLHAGRAQHGQKNVDSVTFVCALKIDGIRLQTPLNYYSCGEKGCKKGVKPSGIDFLCESCEKKCEFPVARYLLRLQVSDSTTAVVVTMFDEVAELLVKKSAKNLLREMKGLEDDTEYPPELENIFGSEQLFELKSHTYYNHGQYESFVVNKVLTRQVGVGPKTPALVVGPDNSPINPASVALSLDGVQNEVPSSASCSNSTVPTETSNEDVNEALHSELSGNNGGKKRKIGKA